MDVAARGDLAAAKLLIERGADVNAVDHRGYTALILAAHYDGDAVELVRLLLARGADINAIAEGETAASLAARRGETEVTKILRKAAGSRLMARDMKIDERMVAVYRGASHRTRTAAADDTVSREALQTAARKGLDLLVKTSPAFVKKGGCNSCHNQMLPAAAQTFARSRGIDVGAPIEQLPLRRPRNVDRSDTPSIRWPEAGASMRSPSSSSRMI